MLFIREHHGLRKGNLDVCRTLLRILLLLLLLLLPLLPPPLLPLLLLGITKGNIGRL